MLSIVFFSIYTNRNVTDKVGPHGDLLDEFPYLGPPHKSVCLVTEQHKLWKHL